mmetsp:Transcript_24098/g.52792  ORF Transcript_24098/g.52792 Transcript_24098/m.52792 type:complete len:84 (+) Transcript_24098:417-668(+)
MPSIVPSKQSRDNSNSNSNSNTAMLCCSPPLRPLLSQTPPPQTVSFNDASIAPREIVCSTTATAPCLDGFFCAGCASTVLPWD